MIDFVTLDRQEFDEKKARWFAHLFNEYPIDKITREEWEEVVAVLLGIIHSNCNATVWRGLGIMQFKPDSPESRKARRQKEIDDAMRWLKKKQRELDESCVFSVPDDPEEAG